MTETVIEESLRPVVHRLRALRRSGASDGEVARCAETVRERIRMLRESLGESVPEFALRMDVRVSTVRRWENGQRVPWWNLLKLASLDETHRRLRSEGIEFFSGNAAQQEDEAR